MVSIVNLTSVLNAQFGYQNITQPSLFQYAIQSKNKTIIQNSYNCLTNPFNSDMTSLISSYGSVAPTTFMNGFSAKFGDTAFTSSYMDYLIGFSRATTWQGVDVNTFQM